MNNKKITIIFILIAFLTLIGIGFTIAYFTSTTDFENEFQTGLYQTTATEVFESPSNWLPGDETPKTLTVTNTGNVDVKARVCIEENWESANGDTLPNEVDGQSVAIINLANTNDWTKKGNCYEYNEVLEPNDTTSSFISSVTFDPNTEIDLNCTPITQNGTITKKCESTGNGYDNATFTLTLTVETAQANKARLVWGYYVGEEICYNTECFYVVSSNQNETVLLAKYNLLVGDVFDVEFPYFTQKYSLNKTLSSSDAGYGLQNENAKGGIPLGQNETTTQYVGTVPFSGTNYWDNSVCNNYGDCIGTAGLLPEYALNGASYYESPFPYVYRSNMGNTISPSMEYSNGWGAVQNNGYTIAYYVEEYVNTLKDLGAPNTITGRLLSYEEIIDLGCSETDWYCSPVDVAGDYYLETDGSAPSWLYSNNYWLGSVTSYRTPADVWFVRTDGTYYYDSALWCGDKGVRPVIEIPTSELN